MEVTNGPWDEFESMMYMEAAHQAVHNSPADPENTLSFTFMQRDVVLIGLALAVLPQAFPCLREESVDFQQRFVEILFHQRPDWTVYGEEE